MERNDSGRRGRKSRDFFEILEDNDIFQPKKEAMSMIKLSNIEPRRDQPRKSFDDVSISELADSIQLHGVLQPIIIRQNPNFPEMYEIIAGERRWRAAKMAGLSEIPAITIDGDDFKAAQIALVENVQREDLNPVEEAMAYQVLIDRFDLTQEQLSAKVGKSRSAIANSLRLVDLPDEVLAMLGNGAITAGHAKAILGLDHDDQMILLAQKTAEKQLSVREVEAQVRKMLAEGDEVLAKDPNEGSAQRRVYMRDLERRAMDKLGRRVKINQTAKKKTVELTFDNDSDLEELLTLLCGDGFFMA